MTPQELKNSILQLAIQGKLVPQLPVEGTALSLKEKLYKKKVEWTTDGRILKKAKTKPFLESDDLFDIPDSWEWVQLSDVSIIQEGAGIRKWQYRNAGTQILCVTNILDGSIDLEKKQLYISTEEYLEKYEHLTLNKGDIVTSCSGGSWGKIAFFDCEDTMMLNTSTLRMRFFDDIADNNYLYYVCKSPFFKRQLELQLSGMQPNFGYAHYSRIVLPLPPLAEQKRIVAKIEELLPYIDRYEKAWSRLEDFNKRFPVDMQKSILQMAIQGKLVEQRPEEGTGEELYQRIQAEKQKLIKEGKIKKEKPLPEISEDEIPFDIPESWTWVRFGELYLLSNGTSSRGSVGGSQRPVLRLADLSSNKIETDNIRKILLTEKEFTSHRVQDDDLIFIRVNGSKERVATAFHYTGKETISYCDHLFCGHKCCSLISADYIMFVFNCSSTRKQLIPEIKTTAGQNTISQTSMAKILLPLPPLAEQKRIVAKLEEILPLCEKLKSK